jgi:hypothetical protein
MTELEKEFRVKYEDADIEFTPLTHTEALQQDYLHPGHSFDVGLRYCSTAEMFSGTPKKSIAAPVTGIWLPHKIRVGWIHSKTEYRRRQDSNLRGRTQEISNLSP